MVAVCLVTWAASPAVAQGIFGLSSRFDLSDSIQLDNADASSKTHLEQIKGFLANDQWDEAVEALREVMETDGNHLVALASRRYVTLRDYCHFQVAALPPAALALYRSRVDSVAEALYRRGTSTNDAKPLRQIVREHFCSTWADDALLALGEMGLESGDLGAARSCWERILPPSWWSRVLPPNGEEEGTATWLVYPDTDIPLADVLARLALVSILDNDRVQAERVLLLLRQEFAQAEGRLAGQQANYVEILGTLLSESAQWKNSPPTTEWRTFAGSSTREKPLPSLSDVGALRWRIQLPKSPAADFGYPPRRVAEDKDNLLSYHPVISGDLLLVNTQHEIRAYNLRTGEPAWGDSAVIYKDDSDDAARQRSPRSSLGAARFTLTVDNHRLYARMGSPVTCSSGDMSLGPRSQGYLVCLDLSREGALLWQVKPPSEAWAFEGSPVADGSRLYVGLRRSDVRPQAHVCALDAQTGHVIWQRFICGAETPAQGQDECTHNLLTLDHGTLYYNTNLGAIVSLDAEAGDIRWMTLYERDGSGDLNQRKKHFFRDLNPCVHDRGVLYAAPADTPDILALHAASGIRLWQSRHPEDAVHLLGVGENHLLASGDKLWWIEIASGRVDRQGAWPDGPNPKGFGRGLLSGDRVFWPTRTAIHVFDQQTGQQARQPIELSERGAVGEMLTGGNLFLAHDGLLVATSDELLFYGTEVGRRADTETAPGKDAAKLGGDEGDGIEADNMP